MEKENFDLGFTFSFPLQQSGLTSGRLISWTKGFKCSGVEGEDVVKLLQEAAYRKKVSKNLRSFTSNRVSFEIIKIFLQEIKVDIVAILNDTVGTLMSLAYTDPMCQIGVIIGIIDNNFFIFKLIINKKIFIRNWIERLLF